MRLIKETWAKAANEEEKERILRTLVEGTLDNAWKKRLQSGLGRGHGVFRTEVLPAGGNKNRWGWPIYLAAAVAAMLLLVVGLPYLMRPSGDEWKRLGTEWLATGEVYHPGGYKGSSEASIHRQTAIEAFNQKNFRFAIVSFEQIALPTEEDRYYWALALLLDGKTSQAVGLFEAMQADSLHYREEIKWYLALGYLMEGDVQKAQTLLSSIQSDEWKFEQAQTLLQKIP